MIEIWISLFAVAIFSAIGALFLYLSDTMYDRISPYLLSLAAGTMFGAVFIHLIFRMANKYAYTRVAGGLVVIGLLLSLVLERLVHWHCHHAETHGEPVPYVLATGDAFHNIIDGVLIATSFLTSFTAGIGAVVAVAVHKIPKEVGDFGVMVKYGFTKIQAVLTNIALSAFMFLGAALVIIASQTLTNAVTILLPIVAGNFLFIAGSDLLPAFKTKDDWYTHIAVFILGAALMYAIPYIKAAMT